MVRWAGRWGVGRGEDEQILVAGKRRRRRGYRKLSQIETLNVCSPEIKQLHNLRGNYAIPSWPWSDHETLKWSPPSSTLVPSWRLQQLYFNVFHILIINYFQYVVGIHSPLLNFNLDVMKIVYECFLAILVNYWYINYHIWVGVDNELELTMAELYFTQIKIWTAEHQINRITWDRTFSLEKPISRIVCFDS